MRNCFIRLLPFFVAALLCSCSAQQHSSSTSAVAMDKLVDSTIATALQCLSRSVDEVKDTNLFPNYANKQLQWKLNNSGDWTSGFYPGTLWYAYELSKDSRFKQWAKQWTNGIEKEKYNNKTHDLGFRFNCAFGNGLRLAANDSATNRYKEILLTAAATANGRFSEMLHLYPSDWDRKKLPNSIPAVVDIMMNLELLLKAAEWTGDTSIVRRCIQHADRTFTDFVRPDGSTFHVVRYSKDDGSVLNKGQLQGDTDSSTWSRGHAWMIYGYTIMYRYTKDTQYLRKATLLTDYFIRHLPENYVANWDFQSNIHISDASASAIVTAALLELQSYLPRRQQRQYYLNEAYKMLQALCSPAFFSQGKGTNCLLLHCTQYYHETPNTDVPCTFGDYYLMEALVRYKQLH